MGGGVPVLDSEDEVGGGLLVLLVLLALDDFDSGVVGVLEPGDVLGVGEPTADPLLIDLHEVLGRLGNT